MQVGTKIEILEPFTKTYPDTYTIISIDGTTVQVSELESAFDFIYIEVA